MEEFVEPMSGEFGHHGTSHHYDTHVSKFMYMPTYLCLLSFFCFDIPEHHHADMPGGCIRHHWPLEHVLLIPKKLRTVGGFSEPLWRQTPLCTRVKRKSSSNRQNLKIKN
jgi:hypothetical protein